MSKFLLVQYDPKLVNTQQPSSSSLAAHCWVQATSLKRHDFIKPLLNHNALRVHTSLSLLLSNHQNVHAVYEYNYSLPLQTQHIQLCQRQWKI